MRSFSPSPGFWISLALHVLVFVACAFLVATKVEYAIDSGKSSVEVNLVAAAPEPVTATPPPPTPEPEVPETPEPPKPDDMVVPLATQTPPPVEPPPPTPEPPKPAPPTPPAPKTTTKRTAKKGDGSSPKPGNDTTTASSEGGAIVSAKPDYLRNPPPTYPETSRQQKQEGLVVLEVIVGTEGTPESVSISASSGFTLLDQSALKAVNGWKFRPATMGGFKVRSRVVVPVRFRLDS